ncbi:MAG: hypothetical protein QM811_26395 [Pirellulales bacterium]
MPCSYIRDGLPHAEPTAVLGLALRTTDATRFADRIATCESWIAGLQRPDGSVPPNTQLDVPGWGTSWALILKSQNSASPNSHKSVNVARALEWLLATKGMQGDRSNATLHDVELVGWPWVTGTHTWLEPTCLAVMALQAQGLADHPRRREGLQVLQNRLLPRGGANYGNTIVLGQELLPHLQASGFVLQALAGQADASGRIAKTRDYLKRELGPATGATSLAFGLLGLLAWNDVPPDAGNWLQSSAKRVLRRDNSPYRLAALALAAAKLTKRLESVGPKSSEIEMGAVR